MIESSSTVEVYKRCQRTILPPLLIVTHLTDVYHHAKVHDTRLHCIEKLKEENAGGDRRILERSDGLDGWLVLLRGGIRPL